MPQACEEEGKDQARAERRSKGCETNGGDAFDRTWEAIINMERWEVGA